ncbi:phage coat protein [Vibrio maritimus]|uniref:phage coat protein n=1 Tax=Vibrio maritimus TaxID=990268 RepID=UPI001F3D8204|nr:phage coat protein [Vibrio maritimus]
MKKAASTIAALTLASLAPQAMADTTTIDSIFAAVDLSTVTAFIGTTGVVIVGIALAVKGISLAKRLVSRA